MMTVYLRHINKRNLLNHNSTDSDRLSSDEHFSLSSAMAIREKGLRTVTAPPAEGHGTQSPRLVPI